MYESKPLKEQGIRKSLSQISLDERKAKKASRKNFTWKRDVSGTTAEGKSLKTTQDSKVNKVEGIFMSPDTFLYAEVNFDEKGNRNNRRKKSLVSRFEVVTYIQSYTPSDRT